MTHTFKEIVDNCTNRRVQRLAFNSLNLGCDRCRPHRGCNRKNWKVRNWKNYRGTQYKIKGVI